MTLQSLSRAPFHSPFFPPSGLASISRYLSFHET
ncbi:hypothetical protein M2311_005212 [Rhizobium leguminosarum]|nr:hypothetical protein [Rhizobium leguminosarum]MDH6275112.1 hypothetical protein [Rhizobium leguminosarum]